MTEMLSANAGTLSKNVQQPRRRQTRARTHLPILYMDGDYCVIDKPRFFSVHAPPQGDEGRRWTTKEQNAMWLLKQQLGGRFVQPVHRLDMATSGLVVYALSRETACWLSDMWKGRNVHKEYFAFVRGYTDTVGVIDKPLDGSEAVSMYETIARVQVPMEVERSPFPLQRFSLVRVIPVTGRTHQIRRHFNRIAHPIIGDGDHGERFLNRKFARELQLPGLFLRATSISFPTQSGDVLTVTSPTKDWGPRWHALFDAMGVYPLIPSGASLLPRIPAQLAVNEKPTPAFNTHSTSTPASSEHSTSTPASSELSTSTLASSVPSTSTPASSVHSASTPAPSSLSTSDLASSEQNTPTSASSELSTFTPDAAYQPSDVNRAAVLQFKHLVSAMQDLSAESGMDLISARQREKGVNPGSGQQELARARGGVNDLWQMQLSEFWSRLPSEPLPVLGQVPSLRAAGDDEALLF